jgi:glycine/D-amino acid oxidase-like deaminating enzyme
MLTKNNLTSQKEYDAIIIGLGCFGLGTAYYL